MSNFNWIFALAIGLAASSLQAQDISNDSQDRAAEQQDTTQQQPLGIPVRIIEDQESTLARQSREAMAAQREQEDLVAQQRMAEATEAMNEATQSVKNANWLSTGFVGIGTFLLLWTLRLTRCANRAARGAVEVTREMGMAQTRAYLSIEGAKIVRDAAGNFARTASREHEFFAKILIRNSGQSPARKVKVSRGSFNVGSALIDNYSPDLKNAQIVENFSVGAGSAVSYDVRTVLSDDDIQALQRREMFVLLAGTIEYSDVFKVVHTTKFSLVVDAFGTEREKVFAKGKFNSES